MSIINCTNKQDKELPPTGSANVGDVLTLETGKIPAWKTPIHKIVENIQNTDDLNDWLRNATVGDMLIFNNINAKNGTDGQEGTDGCFTLGTDNKLYGSCVVENESDIYGGIHIRPCLTYIQFTSSATKVKMCYLADQLLTTPPSSTIVSISGMIGIKYV